MKPESLLGWEKNEISSLENSFSYVKKYLLTMDDEQLTELKTILTLFYGREIESELKAKVTLGF
ncbi:hypothetical protein F6Y05_02525 [Bacillus megaterium]|nr:hypothetical protein [Priestia megaterium]